MADPEPSEADLLRSWLPDALAHGRVGDVQALRRGALAELSLHAKTFRAPRRPSYELCVVASALLDDAALWRKVVSQECALQDYHYLLQRDSGMSRDDLGERPSFDGSAYRLLQGARSVLEEAKSPLTRLILERLQQFPDLGG